MSAPVSTFLRHARHRSLPRLLASLLLGAIWTDAATTQEHTTQPPPNQPPPKLQQSAGSANAQLVPTSPAMAAKDIEGMLVELDGLFERGDVVGYASMFFADHPGVQSVQEQRLEALVQSTPARRRSSTLAGEPRVIGPRTVARVRSRVWLLDGPDGGTRAEFVEDSLLAMWRTDDGRIQPTFRVEIPTDWTWSPSNGYRCPPCNYQIGHVDGWLCVPVRADRANAMEAASFFLMGTDVACDISVTVAPSPVPAATLVSDLGGSMQRLAGEARLQPAEPWQPPAFRASPDRVVDAARLAIDLPEGRWTGNGGRALLYAVTFAGLQHVLLVRGSAASLQAHAPAVQALLGSYRPLDVDGDAAKIAAEARAHHCGGTFAGRTYRNEIYGVEMDGPDGWAPQHRVGGAAFRALWSTPGGSRLWLSGYVVPPSMTQWCQETADAWLLSLLAQQGLQIDTRGDGPRGDSGWSDATQPGGETTAVRTLRLTPTAKGGGPLENGGQAPARIVHVHLRSDLLLLADGIGTTPADEAALQAALATLRRR